ncbi:MAG: hypothetical protein L0H99_11630 [Loigolactobacillus coryniformis]|uniref:Uncharacterized protein n=1 Tax=Loigolactobacillus jiayinensis TaxID=2486016 RepID=A0ABW1RE72_9LACO|nr:MULTISPECIES: hypothetical protein [Loigolactobacillus]MDN5954539.1 hypothetical protein [Loigolactobacillus coryniformis]
MAQPKLVLTKQTESKAVKPVFIDAELHKQILDLKNETGISIGRIAEKFIRYGIQNVEIEDEQ